MSVAFPYFSCLTEPMYSRRHILPDRSLSHVFFRCHNKQFFLRPPEIKKALIQLWAKNKQRYGIRIFDFIVMDNHAHMLVRAESAEGLGNFMRTVNSQLALLINKHFDRDSQAIRERYKSPLITTSEYLHNVMEYIWLNRHRVDGSSPHLDRFCSASWRMNPQIKAAFSGNDETLRVKIEHLLDSYEVIGIRTGGCIRKYMRNALNDALSRLRYMNDDLLLSSHTIGDALTVAFRGTLLAAFKRERFAFGV